MNVELYIYLLTNLTFKVLYWIEKTFYAMPTTVPFIYLYLHFPQNSNTCHIVLDVAPRKPNWLEAMCVSFSRSGCTLS